MSVLPRFLRLSRTERRFLGRMIGASFRPIKPAPVRPTPGSWAADDLTVAWLGHATVLINFCGTMILTDPALNARVGLGWGPFMVGPKRFVAPALRIKELPKLDLVLLTHAHMDHFDLPTLRRFKKSVPIVTASKTSDLLSRPALEIGWGERRSVAGVEIEAFEVRHWGARMRTDEFRGYNGYVLRRNGQAVLIAGDTAYTPLFQRLHGRGGSADGRFDLAVMPIGAYDPWIGAHCTPEQAVAMANDAGARFILPVHHATFQLSIEPMEAPIQRFERALADEPKRAVLLPIGGTFRVPAGDLG